MALFVLPDDPLVLKVIRDHFAPPITVAPGRKSKSEIVAHAIALLESRA